MSNDTRCGYAAILGRPNVGKSTLLNKILKQKISITSHKAQTTRNRILGIKTQENIQTIYVDTPGIHKKTTKMINRFMNKAAKSSIYDVDVIIFIIDAKMWLEEDELILQELKKIKCPVILALNKVDLIKDKKQLLPIIDELSKKMSFEEIIPLSATKNTNIDALEKTVHKHLPEGEFLFHDDQVTDRDDKFFVSEIIREKIIRLVHQEVPYAATVNVESMKMQQNVLHIDAIIWVEKKGQKIIIVGKNGEKLKEIGTKARIDLEKLFGSKVFLSLWVKIKEGWTDDARALSSLGFD